MVLTVKDALKQDVIRKHYQPSWRVLRYSADGCGDNLYRDGGQALKAYKWHKITGQVLTQKQMDSEHA